MNCRNLDLKGALLALVSICAARRCDLVGSGANWWGLERRLATTKSHSYLVIFGHTMDLRFEREVNRYLSLLTSSPTGQIFDFETARL